MESPKSHDFGDSSDREQRRIDVEELGERADVVPCQPASSVSDGGQRRFGDPGFLSNFTPRQTAGFAQMFEQFGISWWRDGVSDRFVAMHEIAEDIQVIRLLLRQFRLRHFGQITDDGQRSIEFAVIANRAQWEPADEFQIAIAGR